MIQHDAHYNQDAAVVSTLLGKESTFALRQLSTPLAVFQRIAGATMSEQEDFEGYMEILANAKAREEQLAAHQLWKESTWQGKAVGMIQVVGRHFSPFVSAVADALKEEKSVGSRILSHLLRVFIVLMGVMTLYILSRIIQMVIGKEIVMEQEVIIEEMVRQSDLVENEKYDQSVIVQSKENAPQRRRARDKKAQ